jgi:hypothetical protein
MMTCACEKLLADVLEIAVSSCMVEHCEDEDRDDACDCAVASLVTLASGLGSNWGSCFVGGAILESRRGGDQDDVEKRGECKGGICSESALAVELW